MYKLQIVFVLFEGAGDGDYGKGKLVSFLSFLLCLFVCLFFSNPTNIDIRLNNRFSNKTITI